MSPAKNNLAIKIASLVLTFATLIFSVLYGRALLGKIEIDKTSLNFAYLVLAFLMFLGFYYLLSTHWYFACKIVDKDSGRFQRLVFFASQPYKYLPTSLFTFSFRAKYARDAGLGLKKSTIAQIIENIDILITGVCATAIFFVMSKYVVYGLLCVLALAGFFAVLPQTFNFRIKKRTFRPRKADLISMVGAGFGAWVVAGLALVALGHGLGLSVNPLVAIAANAAGYIASIAAFFAPGGIGVREFILTFFTIPATLVVAWRLLSLTVDLLVGGAAIFLMGRKTRNIDND